MVHPDQVGPPISEVDFHDNEEQYHDKMVSCQFCSSVQINLMRRIFDCGCVESHVICAVCGKIIHISALELCPIRSTQTMH